MGVLEIKCGSKEYHSGSVSFSVQYFSFVEKKK